MNNIKAFLVLVRAGLWDKEIRLAPYQHIDWQKVFRLAEEQSVVGLVTAGLEQVIDVIVPKEIVLKFAGTTLQQEQKNTAMNVFIAKIVENLRSADISTLLVKGQGIAQCYERPLWRVCGDVDLFLTEKDYAKAKTYLIPQASSIEPEGLYEQHLGMTIDGWVVELHGTLHSGLGSRVEKGLDDIKNTIFHDGKVRSWMNGSTKVFLPREDEDVVYVFTHILQHFYKGGIGLRQICDWCRLLWTYRDSLDHGLLESRIRKMGLMTEWNAFGAFAVDYLGMPAEAMPFYSSKKRWSRKAKKICTFVMKVGNFGHNRDSSYFEKYPYMIRKMFSFGRRCGDLIRHARIFPLDSIRFFPSIVFNGLRSAARGE